MVNKVIPAKTTQNYLFIIPFFVGIIFFYAWLTSAGTGESNGVTSYYYSYLAEAFLDGNLHLAWQPDPHLLALDNPYDPVERDELDKLNILTPVDFSLYDGKFYLYWGPVPSLLLAPIQFFLRQNPVDDLHGICFWGGIIFCTIVFNSYNMGLLLLHPAQMDALSLYFIGWTDLAGCIAPLLQ